jgi:enediyne biosynthesis protein E4
VSATVGWLRKQLPGIVALVTVFSVFFWAKLPTSSAAEFDKVASQYKFESLSIALPGGHEQRTIRKVNQAYKHIDAWISSVGAAIALNDIDGDGLSNDLCVVDTRTDQVVVTPTPGTGSDRYAPFTLGYGSLPFNDAMAPMGCVPGDFNEDGRMDVLVYLWGRTPILHLAKAGSTGRSADSFVATELVPGANSVDGRYTGPQWNSNTATVSDFDGDGHADLYVGNYFPDSPVLDDTVDGGVVMNRSLSHATNGGVDYVFRWTGATSGATPTATYAQDDAFPEGTNSGWDLGVGANDLDGDGLPELYVANDHGPDRLFHNRSARGDIGFQLVEDIRTHFTVPKSKRIGKDSFKGMGVEFGDLNGDGVYDMFISNITTSFGIEESHLAYVSRTGDKSKIKAEFDKGNALWEDKSTDLGLNWTGWGWDAKTADFDNNGQLELAQATGFVKGEVNRWPQLQELATANDTVVEHPGLWPNITEGDDVAGSQTLAFFAKNDNGRYINIGPQLGLAIPVPTRGIATGDADGDGKLDFAVARQWDVPIFYHNASPSTGQFLGLRLSHAGAPGSPVVGAQVTVRTADGRSHLGYVDGGSGHSGKRSHEVHIGLGNVSGPVSVHLQWRDRAGELHEQDLQMTTGWHSLLLGTAATEQATER